MSSLSPSAFAAELAGLLDTSVGVIEVGTLLAAILYGIYLLQVWFYFRTYSDDQWYLKTLVSVVTILDTLQTAFSFHALWYYTIASFGQLLDIETVYWSLATTVYCAGICGFLTQSFFAFRVLRVTRSTSFALFCFTLGAVRFGFSLACGTIGLKSGTFEELQAQFFWGAGVTLADGAAADIIMAVALCLTLFRARSPIISTNKIMDKLVLYIVGTGLITSVVAVVTIICFFTMSNLAWVALLLVFMKLYPNCLLASLNERVALHASGPGSLSFPSTPRRQGTYLKERGISNIIELTTEIEVHRDVDSTGTIRGARPDDESEITSQKDTKERSLLQMA